MCDWKGTVLISTIKENDGVARGIPLYKCCIDLVKTYDTVDRTINFQILEKIKGSA